MLQVIFFLVVLCSRILRLFLTLLFFTGFYFQFFFKSFYFFFQRLRVRKANFFTICECFRFLFVDAYLLFFRAMSK